MSAEYPLRFAKEPGSYKLLELPAELCTLVESGAETQYVQGLYSSLRIYLQ